MEIKVISNAEDEDFLVEMAGAIDEHAVFPYEMPVLSQRVVFECEKVERINSIAIQKWAVWMRALDPRQQFVFRNLPPAIVNVFNVVVGMLPAESVVESFYVPYECENCDTEEFLLARRGQDFIEPVNGNPAKLLLPKEINCKKCKSRMGLAVWGNKYLRFLDLIESRGPAEKEK